MAIFSRMRKGPKDNADTDVQKGYDEEPVRLLTYRVISTAIIVSIGGLIFGYDTGQISGFLEIPDFKDSFSEDGTFSNVRSGLIVGLLSIGTLLGAIAGAPIADTFGRRMAIIFWNVIFIIGVIVQITATNEWYQVGVGRLVAGFGVGGLSVLTPMYMSETSPRQVRGAMVSSYQLFITLGILIASAINLGSQHLPGHASWRLTMGIGFVFPAIMIVGILTLPESPRWDYRKGNTDRARKAIAGSYGVSESHWEVKREIKEIKAKLEAENAGGGKQHVLSVFTGPRMAYRLALGVALQALQQLTGANYFFYYGATIFNSVGIKDSLLTATILAAVNFVCTFGGLYVVEKAGRRRALIIGGLWQFAMFMVFSSIGTFSLDNADPQNTPTAGKLMIVFACLFIAGYAMTWAPIIWAVVAELFPTRYRALAIGICTASNWTWNFLISFFTPFITGDIAYKYGYVFASTNFLGAVVVYFFLCESKGRTLEEIDTMYLMHVPPRQSSKWEPPEDEDLVTADDLYLTPDARDIRKVETKDDEKLEQVRSARKAGSDMSGSSDHATGSNAV